MLPEEIEEYRDKKWRREESLRLKSAQDVEAMVDELGFSLALTDCRTNLPSVYIGVCGRRDAHMPRNVQKDEEASRAWVLKDEVMRRGNVYYSKLTKGRAMFVAKRLIPSFHSFYGISKSKESAELSDGARRILAVLRKEWEAATSDLREDAGFDDRKSLTKAIEELQKVMKVIPYEVVYEPRFSYLWTLTEARFPEELSVRLSKPKAMIEIARAYLESYGMTLKAEFSKALGFKRKESGAAFHALVDEGFAVRVEEGVYRLSTLT
ncbi:MAG: hypothetical protein HKN33_03065 [Pyrinomonadaceae bacterium]|nr:hypothetical protein [Pyrinomonadaceae bacterium]